MRLPVVVAALLLVSIVAHAAQMTLSWSDNSTNETGFRIYRGEGTGAQAPLATVATNIETYVDTTVVAGVTYSYSVSAFNSAGESARSNTVSGSVPIVPALPSAPGSAVLVAQGVLVNVSDRGPSSSAAPKNTGFVISGGPVKVLIRVVGPTLGAAPFNVPGTLADPKLTVMSGGSPVAGGANDNWTGTEVSAAATSVGAFALGAGSKDAALVLMLPAGAYTVVAEPVTAGQSGVVLVEVYGGVP